MRSREKNHRTSLLPVSFGEVYYRSLGEVPVGKRSLQLLASILDLPTVPVPEANAEDSCGSVSAQTSFVVRFGFQTSVGPEKRGEIHQEGPQGITTYYPNICSALVFSGQALDWSLSRPVKFVWADYLVEVYYFAFALLVIAELNNLYTPMVLLSRRP
jgi:hypothetical protein